MQAAARCLSTKDDTPYFAGVETLEELLDAKEFPAVRLGAARTVVELGIHQHDTETILRKLEDLEAAQRRGRH